MERILASQPGASSNPFMMAGMGKKIFEINPNHSIIKNMKKILAQNGDVQNDIYLLFTTTLFVCGYKFDDVSKYCSSVYETIEQSVGKTAAHIEESTI